jgi:hypothetical protein
MEASMAQNTIGMVEGFGRFTSYVFYNVGVGIIVGLARTIISIYYLAKQHFYKETYKAKDGSITGKIKNNTIGAAQDTKIENWEEQLFRGIIEMVPIIGSLYFTYQDNQVIRGGNFKASVYGLKEINKLVKDEYKFDKGVSSFLDTYNPIDYRIQKSFRE